MVAPQEPIHIRWMIRRDMPEVVAIESDVFEFPWSEEDFIRCLRRRACIGMIAEDRDGGICGFMVYELRKSQIKLHNFAVRRDRHRQGIGTAMLETLKRKLSAGRRTTAILMVRESNLPAQLFFKRGGFLATGVLRNEYEDTNEDAYAFKLEIESAAAQPANRITKVV